VRAKVRVAPVQAFADRVVRRALDLNSADEVFRPALVAELRERPYEFDIQVQLCTDLAQMPVEKVTVRWPETLSPYVTVAKLRLPQQDIGGEDNLERMDATSMTPWRVTEAHRPLGNIMRARKEAYRQSESRVIRRYGAFRYNAASGKGVQAAPGRALARPCRGSLRRGSGPPLATGRVVRNSTLAPVEPVAAELRPVPRARQPRRRPRKSGAPGQRWDRDTIRLAPEIF
jgi:hypothetical protein